MRTVITLLLSFLFAAGAAADAVTVDVVVLEHADLPALNEKQLDETLAIAATMILKALDRQVKWNIVERKEFDRFIAEQRKLMLPFRLPAFDIFSDSTADHRKAVIAACKEYGSIDEIKALLPDAARAKVRNEADAADELLKAYNTAIDAILAIKAKSGKLLVTRANRLDFSITEYDVFFTCMDVPKRPTLYLSNTLIIDDNLVSPAPHTMIRGIAHGVAFPASDRALVGYYGHLSGNKRLTGYPWELSDGGKRAAIAYTVAHEVGTHLLLKERDDYDRRALVSRPLPVEESQLLKLDQWNKREQAGKALDMTALHFVRHRLRMEIAIARKERVNAETELKAIAASDCPASWKAYAQEQFSNARWE